MNSDFESAEGIVKTQLTQVYKIQMKIFPALDKQFLEMPNLTG